MCWFFKRKQQPRKLSAVRLDAWHGHNICPLESERKKEEKSLVVITRVDIVSTAALCDHVVCQFQRKSD